MFLRQVDCWSRSSFFALASFHLLFALSLLLLTPSWFQGLGSAIFVASTPKSLFANACHLVLVPHGRISTPRHWSHSCLIVIVGSLLLFSLCCCLLVVPLSSSNFFPLSSPLGPSLSSRWCSAQFLVPCSFIALDLFSCTCRGILPYWCSQMT